MPWLVNAQLPAAGEMQLREQTPALVADRLTGNLVFLQTSDELFDVVAHQIKFVRVILPGMHGHFGRRQAEDEPAMADIHVGELEDISQKSAIGFRILTVNNGMSAGDHAGMIKRGDGKRDVFALARMISPRRAVRPTV